MKKITKKEMIARVKDSYRLFNTRIVDTIWDKESEILTVIAITGHHNVMKSVWYYDHEDDSINYLDGVSGHMFVMKKEL